MQNLTRTLALEYAGFRHALKRTRGRLFAVKRGAIDRERLGLASSRGVTPPQIRCGGVVGGV